MDELLAGIMAGTRHDLGERIVTRLLTEWDRPEAQGRGITLLRGDVVHGVAATMVREFLAHDVDHRLASSIDGGNGDSDDSELRDVLTAVPDWLPVSHAIEALNTVSQETDAAAEDFDELGIVLAFAAAAVTVSAFSLRRKTTQSSRSAGEPPGQCVRATSTSSELLSHSRAASAAS